MSHPLSSVATRIPLPDGSPPAEIPCSSRQHPCNVNPTTPSCTAAGAPPRRSHVLSRQQLFSVYVHTSKGHTIPPSSIFYGREIPHRVNTTRGYAQHVLAVAMVRLLQGALKDPLNTKFVFMSDSSIPLYPPQVNRLLLAPPCSCRPQAGSTLEQFASPTFLKLLTIANIPKICSLIVY
jgi:hypothetical protein